LEDGEIHAVMLHEMAHVLRWDNLISNLQMVLCCVFWFHPLVWFIDRRMLEERELACDEMVLNNGGRSTSYATTLLKIYRFCLGSEVRGLSAVASSNIAKRLEIIQASTVRIRITTFQRLIVVIVLLSCVVFILGAGVLGASNDLDTSNSVLREISANGFTVESAANIQTEIQRASSIDSHAFKINLTFNTDARGNVFSFTLEGWDDTLTVQKIVLPPPSLTGTAVFHVPGSAGAKIVAVAGSFNGWNQSQFLFARIDGEWVCRINLPPGRYLYKFIVDGNWIVDPANKVTERDGRGNVNSVLTVE